MLPMRPTRPYWSTWYRNLPQPRWRNTAYWWTIPPDFMVSPHKKKKRKTSGRITMRKIFFALLAVPAALILALAPVNPAQAKGPEKPVRIAPPFGPGGGPDVTSGIMGAKVHAK